MAQKNWHKSNKETNGASFANYLILKNWQCPTWGCWQMKKRNVCRWYPITTWHIIATDEFAQICSPSTVDVFSNRGSQKYKMVLLSVSLKVFNPIFCFILYKRFFAVTIFLSLSLAFFYLILPRHFRILLIEIDLYLPEPVGCTKVSMNLSTSNLGIYLRETSWALLFDDNSLHRRNRCNGKTPELFLICRYNIEI